MYVFSIYARYNCTRTSRKVNNSEICARISVKLPTAVAKRFSRP
jgi:hypothetical protein